MPLQTHIRSPLTSAAPISRLRRARAREGGTILFFGFLSQAKFRSAHLDPPELIRRLLNHDDWNDMPRADLHLVLELTEPCPQSSDIAAENRMLRHLFSAARRQRCNQPGRSTKFQRDENRAKIGADSGRRLGSVSDNLHGRLQSGWVSNLTLPERWSLSTPHGISLLIDREDDGMSWWIDIEADD